MTTSDSVKLRAIEFLQDQADFLNGIAHYLEGAHIMIGLPSFKERADQCRAVESNIRKVLKEECK